jgi:hypothetical protein
MHITKVKKQLVKKIKKKKKENKRKTEQHR